MVPFNSSRSCYQSCGTCNTYLPRCRDSEAGFSVRQVDIEQRSCFSGGSHPIMVRQIMAFVRHIVSCQGDEPVILADRGTCGWGAPVLYGVPPTPPSLLAILLGLAKQSPTPAGAGNPSADPVSGASPDAARPIGATPRSARAPASSTIQFPLRNGSCHAMPTR